MLRVLTFDKLTFCHFLCPCQAPQAAPSSLWADGLGGCTTSGLLRGRFLEGLIGGHQRALVALRNFGGRGGEGRWPLFSCWRGSVAGFTGEFWIHLPEREMFEDPRIHWGAAVGFALGRDAAIRTGCVMGFCGRAWTQISLFRLVLVLRVLGRCWLICVG